MTDAWMGKWDGFIRAMKAQPIGTVMQHLVYEQDVMPSGSIYINSDHGPVLANGEELTVADYPKLYAVIGNTYGGTPPDTFRLPDMRGRVILPGGSEI